MNINYCEAIEKQKFVSTDSKTKLYFMNGINRSIIPGHVTKMVNSIQKLMNIIRPVICVSTSCLEGVKRLYIIDGQHLFTACTRIGCSFPMITLYSESKEEIVEWIAQLNNSSKSWCLTDYINAWKSLQGKEDYIILLNAINTFDLETRIVASCYTNKRVEESTKLIKKGNFKILNKEKGDSILKDSSDLFSVLKGNRESRDFVKSFMNSYISWRYTISSYNHNKFLEFLKKNKEIFHTLVSSSEKADELLNRFK